MFWEAHSITGFYIARIMSLDLSIYPETYVPGILSNVSHMFPKVSIEHIR